MGSVKSTFSAKVKEGSYLPPERTGEEDEMRRGRRHSENAQPANKCWGFQPLNAPIGLQAAMTVHLACREVTMPALEMEMLCCSIASWILVLSASFI